jgi:two-component system LytT family response regulator
MRVLIADDEPLARSRLRAMLRQEPAVEIIGECATGPDAIAVIRAEAPDAVFLDLQMPGCDGLTVAAEQPVENRPVIVFVTGHDRHAVDAFRLGATDYLLKPFDQERLRAALQRIGEHLRARQAGAIESKIETMLARSSNAARGPARFAVKLRGRVVFLVPEDICRVEAADNYVILHLVTGERHMLRESLQAVEERLGAGRFARVNRSTLVQLEQIRELRSNAYGDHTVILRNGTRVPLSRKLRGKLADLVGG